MHFFKCINPGREGKGKEMKRNICVYVWKCWGMGTWNFRVLKFLITQSNAKNYQKTPQFLDRKTRIFHNLKTFEQAASLESRLQYKKGNYSTLEKALYDVLSKIWDLLFLHSKRLSCTHEWIHSHFFRW